MIRTRSWISSITQSRKTFPQYSRGVKKPLMKWLNHQYRSRPHQAPSPMPPNPANLPGLPLSAPGDDWVVDFEEIQAFEKVRLAGRSTKVQNDQWLASEKNWKYRIGKGWKGKKILGRGGQGIVGHWTYEGADRDQKSVKDLAVKQSLRAGPAYTWGDGLESEAMWLARFARAKTPHIVRMYKHLFEEQGQRTIDLDWGLVQRIYLEYCEGGDLSRWLNQYHLYPRNVAEGDLWCIFQCLARAAFVMHHGSEDSNSERYLKDGELVHFDLKLGNILIGDQTLDNEHRNQPPYKITDFGMAKKCPTRPQDAKYLAKYESIGTPPFYAPEQITRLLHAYASSRPWMKRSPLGILSNAVNPMVRNPRYGTATNIWQIGLVMQVLMRKPPSRGPDWENYTAYQSNATPRLATGGLTVGSLLDADQDTTGSSIYSKELRSLIAECLLLSPTSRISPQELMKRTEQGLNTVQMSMSTVLGPPLGQWQEPVVSAQWLEVQNENGSLPGEFQALQIGGNAKRNRGVKRPPVVAKPVQVVAPRGGSSPEGAQAQAPPAQNIQAGPSRPVPTPPRAANAAPRKALRVIVQTKPKYGGLVGGGHKIFTLEPVSEKTTVVQVKDMLERKGCGIKATSMNMMCGRTLMRDHQTLGEFPGADAVRAMDA